MQIIKIILLTFSVIGLYDTIKYLYLLIHAQIRINRLKKINEKQKKASGSL